MTLMTLDETIEYLEEMVEEDEIYDIGDLIEKDRQLLEWFTELKQLREQTRWIPCSERLPKEETNPITDDFYEYQCTFHAYGVYDVRSYKYGNGHWWHGAGIMDDSVIAWRENPEPYKAESEPQESEE